MSNTTNNSKALTTASAKELKVTGSFRDAQDITSRLQHAAKHYHLVSPATACAIIPEGCSVTLSTVLVDVENETYELSGKRGLAKSALDKIAAAAGISWDARLSGRLDDSSDPHYVMWRAVGSMRHLDGTIVQLMGCKEMDLRRGSAQLEALNERYEAKRTKWIANGRKGYEPKSPDGQIREMRLHILSHAESKARLRAVRALGIRSAYNADELTRPFVVAKLSWSGQSDDPELRRIFALKQADAMLSGTRALYGDQQTPPPAPLPPASGMPNLGVRRPPPVGQSAEAGDPDAIDVPSPPPSEPKAKSEPKPAAKADEQREPSGGPACRFGKQKDVPLADLDDEDLDWYANAVKASVEDPKKARFKADNEAHYREVCAERDRRNGVPDEESESAEDGDSDRGPNPDDY